ncbi:MAG: ribosome maturation factor RimM [Clostridia bacterium]|nr:ribosome maturation factor RimM [Clostridia bacterium]
MLLEYLQIGRVTSTHGLKGEVRFEPWCDGIKSLENVETVYFGPDGTGSAKLERVREQGRMFIVKLSCASDVDSAAELRGKILYCRREDLRVGPGRWFLAELIGCEVRDADSGAVYGKITDINNNGASDVWTVASGEKSFLFPAVGEMIVSVDVENCVCLVRPIRGIFDDGEPAD